MSVMTESQKDRVEKLDFDQLAQLAQDDPQAFEARREAAIEALIESLPVERQERMRRLQWRIDQERRLAKSPMGACIRLSRLMWRQVLGEGGLRDRLIGLVPEMHPGAATGAGHSPSGRVVSFVRAPD
jgi:hypothetical protein